MVRWRISFLGLGYVGLTTAACFASRGFKVIGYDIDREKVKTISDGKSPFYEPYLNSLIKKSVDNGFLKLSTDSLKTILNTDITFITVGTPSKKDGDIDLSYIKNAAKMIGEALKLKDEWHLIIVKSTVIPTTTERIIKPIIENVSGKIFINEFGLCVNPEFLREGSAVRDTFKPDRIIIGESDKRSGDILENLYRDFYKGDMPVVIRTTNVNAELIKYVNNAFLAMKVSFINMIADLCQKIPGADVELIAKGIGLDKRIGPLFLRAGAGWGGSCWGKDLKALKSFADKIRMDLPLVESTLKINDRQPYLMIDLAKDLIGKLSGRRIAVLGLSFKPDTDDMRDAVSIKIVNELLDEDAKVVVYDPAAVENARRIFGERVEYASSTIECLKDTECALIVTEWDEFKKLKPEDFIRYMKIPAVVDGRRIYDPNVYSSRLRFAAIGLGNEKYLNPALAVNAIIIRNKKILLVKRAIEPYKGEWSLPGGFIEYDETVEQALVREVEEETGLKVRPKKIIDIYSHPLRSPVKHVISICYEAEVIGGSLKTRDESYDVRYFSLNKLPNQLAFDHLRMIKDYLT